MDISVYFEPVESPDREYNKKEHKKRMGDEINSFNEEGSFPLLENIDIAIIGVKEDRRAINNAGCAEGPAFIRKNFYKLFEGTYNTRIADLGNIKSGHSIDDTYFALANVCSELIQNKIIPLIIGGSQDLTYANYLAYENLGQTINMFCLDPVFDLGSADDEIHSQSYLSRIILHQPNFLFNYTNAGYQTYFVDKDAVVLMDKLFFDSYRLGLVRTNIEEVEPMVRNADLFSFDISSIRQSDAPGNGNSSPNGFYGEEACQIIRYAGLSDKLTSIGFYEYNPVFDNNEQTAMLVAQMIWYFIDGFYNRKKDYPSKDKDGFIKYHVTFKEQTESIVFYKSKKSDRWWMEVPLQTELRSKYERHYLVPCSYNDYQTAMNEDLPERWWQTFKKFM